MHHWSSIAKTKAKPTSLIPWKTGIGSAIAGAKKYNNESPRKCVALEERVHPSACGLSQHPDPNPHHHISTLAGCPLSKPHVTFCFQVMVPLKPGSVNLNEPHTNIQQSFPLWFGPKKTLAPSGQALLKSKYDRLYMKRPENVRLLRSFLNQTDWKFSVLPRAINSFLTLSTDDLSAPSPPTFLVMQFCKIIVLVFDLLCPVCLHFVYCEYVLACTPGCKLNWRTCGFNLTSNLKVLSGTLNESDPDWSKLHWI